MFADKYHHQRLRLLNEMAAAGIPASLVDRLLKDFFKEAVSAAEMASIIAFLRNLPWGRPARLAERAEMLRRIKRDLVSKKQLREVPSPAQLLALGDGEVEFDRNFKPKNRS